MRYAAGVGPLRIGAALGWRSLVPQARRPTLSASGAIEVSFSEYDSKSLRALSLVQAEAMEVVMKSVGRQLTEAERSDFSRRIAENLMTAYDEGERDPIALRTAALRGVFVPTRRN